MIDIHITDKGVKLQTEEETSDEVLAMLADGVITICSLLDLSVEVFAEALICCKKIYMDKEA